MGTTATWQQTKFLKIYTKNLKILPFGDNIKAGEKYCIKESVPMSIKNEYLKGVYEGLAQRNPEQKE